VELVCWQCARPETAGHVQITSRWFALQLTFLNVAGKHLSLPRNWHAFRCDGCGAIYSRTHTDAKCVTCDSASFAKEGIVAIEREKPWWAAMEGSPNCGLYFRIPGEERIQLLEANDVAEAALCEMCGVIVLAGKGGRNMSCLSCKEIIRADESVCSKCGWTYKSSS